MNMPIHNSIHSGRGSSADLRRGFSLIELMIVIAIIGIIAGIAIPSFHHYIRKTNFRTAVYGVTSDLFLVKERAISESRNYRLSFNVGGTTYTIDQGTSAGAPYTTIQTKNLTDLAQGVSFASATYSGNAFITCQPRGTCTAGNVQLSDTTRTATLTTNTTGRTYVQSTGE